MLKTVLVTALLAYACVVGLLWLAQESLLFFPQPARGTPAAPAGWSLERVSIATADGVSLAGVLAKPPPLRGVPGQGRAVVLYFGGNAEEVTANARDIDRLYGQRAVLLVNYRGYGDSGGHPGEKSMVADALALYDWAASRGDLDPERFCVHGRSLGSGVAVHLAAARKIRCVVLTSPFTSLVDVAASHYPWVPVKWLLRHRFDARALTERLTAPALVIYGSHDSIIAPEHSENLAAAWRGPVERLRLEGRGHNDLDLDPRNAPAIAAFLDRHD